MRIAVLEDERESEENIKAALERWGSEEKVPLTLSFFRRGEDFLKSYEFQYDVVFMDIVLPGITGLQTAELLREKDPAVILLFLTNMAQYAIDGYQYSASDYFVKPFSYYSLKMRMDRIRQYLDAKKQSEYMIRLSNGMIRVSLGDIYYIESEGHDTTFHTADGVFTTRDKSMKQLEKELYPYHFRRCNVSYLVNLKHCRSVVGYDLYVANDKISISRAKRKEFLSEMSNYLSGGGS